MSIDPKKEASLLAPLADAYGPTPAQAARLLAKLEAAVAQDVEGAAASNEAPRSSAEPAVRPSERKGMLLGGLSCLGLALAILGGVFMSRASSTQPAVVPAAVVSSPAAPTPEAPRDDEDQTPAVPSISAHALPSATVLVRREPEKKLSAIASSAPSETGEPKRPSDDTLDREARLLANARRLRNSGDDTRALGSLDEHAREFPHGLLESERMAERVVVLCNLGRKDEAVREAARFLERHPKGALARRVETSCAGEAMKGHSP